MRTLVVSFVVLCLGAPVHAQDIQTYSESRLEYDRLISRIEFSRILAGVLEAETLPYPPQHIKVDDWDFLAALPAADVLHPPVDPYGGVAPLPAEAEVYGVPGFFRTAKVDGAWWLVTPDDNLFLSIAVTDINHLGHTLGGNNPYADWVEAAFDGFEEWADDALAQIRGWGFNTLGPWSSPELFDRGIPYTVIVDLSPRMGYADSENRVPDYFAEDFEERADAHIAQFAKPYRDDPWLVGFFVDNEAVWGPDWRTDRAMIQIYLSMSEESAGRGEALQFLREHGGASIEDFNELWGVQLSSWDALGTLAPGDLAIGSDETTALSDAFTVHVFRRYASVAREALDRHAPNHLVLGCRFHDFLGDAIMIEAARHFDVVSLACYWMMPPTDRISAIADRADRPFLIEEFSFRGMDSGLPNELYAGPNVPSQYDRAIAYYRYVTEFMRQPYAVSIHWYKYFDNPGVAPGVGENYGLVNAQGEPYAVFARMVEAVNSRLHALRLPAEE